MTGVTKMTKAKAVNFFVVVGAVLTAHLIRNKVSAVRRITG